MPELREVVPGLRYRHISSSTPTGEPHSVHVLEVDRREPGLQLRSVYAQSDAGHMQRELPTTMAAGADGASTRVLAVVNGDYDLPAPYLGVSDGLAITSGRLWTTGNPERPAFALLDSGEPVIAYPQVTLELRGAGRRWTIGALNKPFTSVHGRQPRLYTREFRPEVSSDRPLRAVIIGKIAPALPLRADSKVRGTVEQVIENAAAIAIPGGKLVVVEEASNPPGMAGLRPGHKVEVRTRVRFDGRGHIRDVVGGFPVLVRAGQRSVEGRPSPSLAQRHPRTAACYNQQKIIFVVVDGRQPALSVGMTLEELADFMVSLGCTVAMNTDGGGSSVMAVAATDSADAHLRIVNSPSDGKERGRGNAWLVFGRKIAQH